MAPVSRREALLERIESGTARVGVLGLGYVGLPVVTAFAEAGFRTLGFDIDERVVRRVRRGESHVGDVAPETVAAIVGAGLLDATIDFGRLGKVDAVIICVPTPLGKTGDPDVSHILDAVSQIGACLRAGQLIVLESTTYPGTTRELLQPELERGGLRAGEDFFLAFSPERVDPGNANYTFTNTAKVVGGLTETCGELAVALYGRVIEEVVRVASPEAAELTKLLENTFRAVNIGLVNEMAVIADRLGIDIWEVVEAAATKPYGFMRFTPGPGLGGHCLPVDPHYLAWKMRTLQYRTRFIELAAEVNAEMPRYVVDRIAQALNRRRLPVNGSRVLLLGVAYKPDVGDVRESPALDIIELLRRRGAEVGYHDPFVPHLALEGGDLESQPLDEARVEAADAVVVVTDHREVDYDLVLEKATLVIDTRNGLRGRTGAGAFYPLAGPPRSGSAPNLEPVSGVDEARREPVPLDDLPRRYRVSAGDQP
ncbi:nucleotide sugar dehydrogenase [Candidatus Palauibacter sp.]|uniref:nucleotide sugar dehydrogenase n=1 Tax=Candidatus Palauibacter sp. TaxID=3101350 RepID=UPI003CC5A828